MIKAILIFTAGAGAGVLVYRLAKVEERCCGIVAKEAAARLSEGFKGLLGGDVLQSGAGFLE